MCCSLIASVPPSESAPTPTTPLQIALGALEQISMAGWGFGVALADVQEIARKAIIKAEEALSEL